MVCLFIIKLLFRESGDRAMTNTIILMKFE